MLSSAGLRACAGPQARRPALLKNSSILRKPYYLTDVTHCRSWNKSLSTKNTEGTKRIRGMMRFVAGLKRRGAHPGATGSWSAASLANDAVLRGPRVFAPGCAPTRTSRISALPPVPTLPITDFFRAFRVFRGACPARLWTCVSMDSTRFARKKLIFACRGEIARIYTACELSGLLLWP